MGFLAPALPFIGPGISAIGSLFGGGQSGQQKASTQMMADMIGQLQGNVNKFSPYATSNLAKSNEASSQAMNFWSPVLSGSRTAAASAFAPDVNRVNEQFQGVLDQTRGERSGAGASIYANAPYDKQAQIQSIYQQARPQAANAMGQIAQQTGTTGNQTLQSMLTALASALGGAGGMAVQADNAYAQSREAGKSFASSLSGIFDQLGGLDIFKKKEGTGSMTPLGD